MLQEVKKVEMSDDDIRRHVKNDIAYRRSQNEVENYFKQLPDKDRRDFCNRYYIEWCRTGGDIEEIISMVDEMDLRDMDRKREQLLDRLLKDPKSRELVDQLRELYLIKV